MTAGRLQLSYVSQSPSADTRSPLMISRDEEKKKLASLNDRLATYIDGVHQLKTENSRISLIAQSHGVTVQQEVTRIKVFCEEELNRVRGETVDLTNEKAKLQFENEKLKTDLEDFRVKYDYLTVLSCSTIFGARLFMVKAISLSVYSSQL